MLSSSSTFASDLIDACVNASAEMLDLHLTPYDLKSVHEYQISNHKKLTEVIQLLKCLLEENSRLKLTIGEIRDEISSRHTKTQGIQQTGEVISQQPPMSSLFQKSTEPINNQKHCHEASHSNNLHPINSTTQSDLNYLDFPTLQQAHSSTLKPNAHPRGWAIAAACLPPSKSSREDRIIESPIVEIAGDIPEGNLRDKISSFVLRFNSTVPCTERLRKGPDNKRYFTYYAKKCFQFSNCCSGQICFSNHQDFVLKTEKIADFRKFKTVPLSTPFS